MFPQIKLMKKKIKQHSFQLTTGHARTDENPIFRPCALGPDSQYYNTLLLLKYVYQTTLETEITLHCKCITL